MSGLVTEVNATSDSIPSPCIICWYLWRRVYDLPFSAWYHNLARELRALALIDVGLLVRSGRPDVLYGVRPDSMLRCACWAAYDRKRKHVDDSKYRDPSSLPLRPWPSPAQGQGRSKARSASQRRRRQYQRPSRTRTGRGRTCGESAERSRGPWRGTR